MLTSLFCLRGRTSSSVCSSFPVIPICISSATRRFPPSVRAAWASTSSGSGEEEGTGEDNLVEAHGQDVWPQEETLVIETDEDLQGHWKSMERRALQQRPRRPPGSSGRTGAGKLNEMDIRLAAGDPSIVPDPRSTPLPDP